MHVARQHRQHGADRQQAAEGDREEAGEGEAGPVRPALARRPSGRSPQQRGEVVDDVVGLDLGRRPRPRSSVPLRTRIVASPARRPPSMSEERRSPTIATRGSVAAPAAERGQARSRTGGARACRRSRRRGRRRSRPRPGSRRSRATRRPASASSGRGWWRSGRRRRRAPASRSAAPRSRSRGGRRRRRRRPRARPRPRARSTPAAATISFSVVRPITKALPSGPAASPARRAATMPAVTIWLSPDLDPEARAAAPRRQPGTWPGCW